MPRFRSCPVNGLTQENEEFGGKFNNLFSLIQKYASINRLKDKLPFLKVLLYFLSAIIKRFGMIILEP